MSSLSYHNSLNGASAAFEAEIQTGRLAVATGTYLVGNSSVSIIEDGDAREASPMETIGIIRALSEIVDGAGADECGCNGANRDGCPMCRQAALATYRFEQSFYGFPIA